MILADFSLLRRRRDLRLLVFGYTVSLLGTMFTQVALAVQVYDLTGSTLALALPRFWNYDSRSSAAS